MASSVIAVDLGGTKVAVAAVDERGKIRDRLEEKVDATSTDAPIDQIVRLARAIGVTDAVGVAVPGLARRNGTVWAPNLPNWDAVPLARILKRKLRVPVIVDSDRNAAVLGEAWRGAARGKRDVVVLIVGTGIGAGILSDGRLVRGAHELSGCAGWMVVTEEVNEKTRGSGSLESLAAGPALSADTAWLANKARNGDRDAQAAFKRAGSLLGSAVANLISLFDPETIVLTGGLTNAADLFLDELIRAARDRAQPLSAPKIDIVVSRLGLEANLLGAARLALSALESR
jgi:glucokinase